MKFLLFETSLKHLMPPAPPLPVANLFLVGYTNYNKVEGYISQVGNKR